MNNNIWDKLHNTQLELKKLPREPSYIQLAEHAIEYIQIDEIGEYLPLPYGDKWIRNDIIRTEKGCFIKFMN